MITLQMDQKMMLIIAAVLIALYFLYMKKKGSGGLPMADAVSAVTP